MLAKVGEQVRVTLELLLQPTANSASSACDLVSLVRSTWLIPAMLPGWERSPPTGPESI